MIARLKAEWAEDLARWERRGLWARSYVYLWADGVCLQARQDADAQYVLLLSGGATPEGRKDLVGFTDDYRESAQSWRRLNGKNQLPKIIQGVRFANRIKVAEHQAAAHHQVVRHLAVRASRGDRRLANPIYARRNNTR